MTLLEKPGLLIGMVHLAPLPESPRYGGSMEAVHRSALRDARVLADAGFDAILVENYGDLPFHPGRVPAVTVAAMSASLERLRSELPTVPLGVNVLRNDAATALAIAAATGGAFVRVNVLCGSTVTDQGLLEGSAHETLRVRAALAPRVAILADAGVKHGQPLAALTLEEQVQDVVERGLADGVLITGPRTGAPASTEEVRTAALAAGDVPVLVASGVNKGNAIAYLDAGARGFIVGTALKRGGRTEAPVDPARARDFVKVVTAWRGQGRRS